MIYSAESIARLARANMELQGALELAYLTLLRMPIGTLRITSQHVLAAARNAIAESSGRDPQDVQEEFEARAFALGD